MTYVGSTCIFSAAVNDHPFRDIAVSHRFVISPRDIFIRRCIGVYDVLGSSGLGVGTTIQKVRLPSPPKFGHLMRTRRQSELRGSWDVAIPKVNPHPRRESK
jgi:hypothetical protein